MKFNFKKVIGIGLLSVGIFYIANKTRKVAISDAHKVNPRTQENKPVLGQQEQEQAKSRKKKKGIIKITLFTILLFASGVLAQSIEIQARAPLSLEAFVTVMQENGYELLNATEDVIRTSFQDDAHTVLVAGLAGHQFELFEFINTRIAQQFFQGLVTTWAATPDLSASPYMQNGINFNIFQLGTNDYYFQILRVENMLILAQGNQSYQNDIREIFRLIEYAD